MLMNATQASAATTAATGTGTTGTGTTYTGTGSTTGTGSSGTGSVTSAATLGGTDFLTLMLAQLKNQDPTSPVDSNTFLSPVGAAQRSAGHYAAEHFVQHAVEFAVGEPGAAGLLSARTSGTVTSPTAQLAAGGTVTGSVSVPQTTSSVVLSIADSTGNVVRTIPLGAQAAGLASFTWDGKETSGSAAPAGTYTFSVAYAGQTQTSGAATTWSTARSRASAWVRDRRA